MCHGSLVLQYPQSVSSILSAIPPDVQSITATPAGVTDSTYKSNVVKNRYVNIFPCETHMHVLMPTHIVHVHTKSTQCVSETSAIVKNIVINALKKYNVYSVLWLSSHSQS